MTILTHVRRLLATPDVVYECRRCGTSLEPDADGCDVCGSTDVVRYDIE
jgi:rRNA maturation endonuclease Nob1